MKSPDQISVTMSYDLEDGTSEDWTFILEPVGLPSLLTEQTAYSLPRLELIARAEQITVIRPDNVRERL